MNKSFPVFTVQNECLDCYKCIRTCHVKAIRINNGHASIISEKCLACGHCVNICPQHAKKVRNDVSKIKELITSGKKVIVSIAPSWTGTFDLSDSQLVRVLKKVGFYGVSETALGAQEVSIETAKILSKGDLKLHISSACPVTVDYIRLYMPEYTKYITNLASPALTHAKMLKEIYGDDSDVVFIGPCIAKKNESDRHPDVISAAITFEELKNWLRLEGVSLDLDINEDIKETSFIPESANEGALYPIEGGMNQTIEQCGISKKVQLLSISSLQKIKEALKGLNVDTLTYTVFVEALACEGGCAKGPCISTQKPGISIISDIISKVKTREAIPDETKTVFNKEYQAIPIKEYDFSIEEILTTMKTIGKYNIEDELNCGGCGYDTCRELANALLKNEAEPSMCSSYMRKIATKKAGAMLKFMPSGIVMVDNNLKIIETNEAFLKMFTPEIFESFQDRIENIAGANLSKIFPHPEIFKSAMRSGQVIHKERFPIEAHLFDITAFTIEKNLIVGAVITDVTETEMKREQIAKKAQAVISKNISIVQNIACMLGEHMVDTELLLNSIAEGYDTNSEDVR